MSSVEICRRRDLGFCPGKGGLRGHAATSNSNEIAGIMRRLLCTSRAPGTTHAYHGLFAGEVPIRDIRSGIENTGRLGAQTYRP
jgi:hypothetical protein